MSRDEIIELRKHRCTAADWANTFGTERKIVTATAVLALVDINVRRETFIVNPFALISFIRGYSPRVLANSINRGAVRRFFNTGSTLMNGIQLKRSSRDLSNHSIASLRSSIPA